MALHRIGPVATFPGRNPVRWVMWGRGRSLDFGKNPDTVIMGPGWSFPQYREWRMPRQVKLPRPAGTVAPLSVPLISVSCLSLSVCLSLS